MTSLEQLSNSSKLSNSQIYKNDKLQDDGWEPVGNNYGFLQIIQCKDGSFAGIQNDNRIIINTNIKYDTWVPVGDNTYNQIIQI